MIYKFLDRPVPFYVHTDLEKMKRDLIDEFEKKYFKLSNMHKDYLMHMPCRWLGAELAKIIKGENIEQRKA
ncbi:hypothetical protein P7D29_01725 [Lactococcus petauri]|uniref:hypothetical protein n=1 Tax=Lactococcus petauri TaxID=1940789 RepID=UPI00288D7516|nr:hypothetical protein [Lactococcus petauri]MDT2593632.1 hypothetical protein [Lactococcus petauri]